jgi:hypothetical protein
LQFCDEATPFPAHGEAGLTADAHCRQERNRLCCSARVLPGLSRLRPGPDAGALSGVLRPLEERKAKLQELLGRPPAEIQYSEHLELLWADNGYNARQVNNAVAANPDLRIEIVKRSDDMKGFVVPPRRVWPCR